MIHTELIIVIAIIGILAAVLVPTLSGYIRKSREAALTQEAKSISAIYEIWLVDPDGALDVIFEEEEEGKDAEEVGTERFNKRGVMSFGCHF
jgi:Tfp pilus assembly major pilin PilA